MAPVPPRQFPCSALAPYRRHIYLRLLCLADNTEESMGHPGVENTSFVESKS